MKSYQYYLLLSFVACWGCADFQEREFLRRELSGPIVKLEDITHGKFYFYIKDYKTKDTVRYALRSMSKFLKDNNIREGDSLSKEANSRLIWFYKKIDGEYKRKVQLSY